MQTLTLETERFRAEIPPADDRRRGEGGDDRGPEHRQDGKAGPSKVLDEVAQHDVREHQVGAS
jgi:hypothetical protein